MVPIVDASMAATIDAAMAATTALESMFVARAQDLIMFFFVV
jgi:hypothetical protein